MAAATFDVVEIATQVVEAIGTIASAMSSAALLEVAEDNYDLYRQQKDYYNSTFQMGVEAPLVAEVMAMPRLMLDYSAQAATVYNASTGPFGGQVGDAGGWWDRHAAMYNTVRNAHITEYDADMSRLRSDWANYLFRFEEHNTDILNDIRWNRRLALHNVGIKQGTSISAALSTAFSGYEDAMNDSADQFATFANGAASYAGYRKGMSDTNSTFYESTHTSSPKAPRMGTGPE